MSSTAFRVQQYLRQAKPQQSTEFDLRRPEATDGSAIHALIAQCPPLDLNSCYAYVLQCEDFADTCVLAENDDRMLGWISAYRQPADPATLFVWQVAVHADARGRSLGKKMLLDLLRRPSTLGVERIKTTVTADNLASMAMFEAVAETLRAPLRRRPGFDRHAHLGGEHASEYMLTIGPFFATDRAQPRPRTQ